MLGQFTAQLAKENMNINVMGNKSKKEYADTMIDEEADIPAEVEE